MAISRSAEYALVKPFCLLVGCLMLLPCLAPLGRAREIELDLAQHSDPQIDIPRIVKKANKFDPRLKPLWLEALGRPENDLKRQAAEAIARAHALGMPGMAEVAPRLVEELEAPDVHPVVRLATARALAVLEARQAAPVLMKHAESGNFDLSRMLEPALARWQYAPMRPIWLARLEAPATPHEMLLLAIQSMALAKWSDAAPHLRRLALDAMASADIRLEAARALALLQPTGLENDARSLAANKAVEKSLDRLVAATLLTQHRGSAAVPLLLELAVDREPAVAAIAVGRLLEIDPAKLDPLLDGLVKQADSGLRQLAARALIGKRTPEAVARLGPLLDDPHKQLRLSVRDALLEFAELPPLAQPVRQVAMQMLSSAGPRGREQAVLIIGVLRFQPAADRLLELLDDLYGEVAVPAAWALRRVNVPATAVPVFKRVQTSINLARQPQPAKMPPSSSGSRFMGTQLPYLIELLGLQRHRPVVPLLKEFLPVPPPMPRGQFQNPTLRSTAFWALGHIYAGETEPELVALFRERLINDLKPNREFENMRAVAAINLGRMKVQDAVPMLRRYYEDASDTSLTVRRACGWAMEQITGMAVPPLTEPPAVMEVQPHGWFLEPADGLKAPAGASDLKPR